MDELDRHGALPDCRRDPLRRTTTDITSGEHPRTRGLERIRIAREGPDLGTTVQRRIVQGPSRHDEAALVDQQTRATYPVRMGDAADADEQRMCRDDGFTVRARVSERNRSEP